MLTQQTRRRALVLGFLAYFLALAPLAWGQESSSRKKPKPTAGSADPQTTAGNGQSDDRSGDDDQPISQQPKAPIVTSEAPPVRELGRARSLQRQSSPLQLGPIYVSSISLFTIIGDGLQFEQANNSVRLGTNVAGVFRTNIVYDKQLGRARLALQYQPQLAILNGEVQSDLSSHAIDLGATYLLSPRWSVGIFDSYVSTTSRMLTGDFFLDVDSVTGRTQQNAFLETQRRRTSNSAVANFNYRVNARDRLSIAPLFNYDRATLLGVLTSTYTYGSAFGWDRTFSERKRIGVFYHWERRQFSRSLLNTTIYQSFGLNYSYRIGSSWQLLASLGAGTNSNPSDRQWTIVGDLSILKSFRRSSISLAYYRGNSLNQFPTNGYTDRVDLGYSILLSRHWRVATAGGHLRGTTVGQNLAASYVSGRLNYRLWRRLSWFANSGHRWQNGDVRELIQGGRTFFATGFQWDANQAKVTEY